MMNEVFMEAHVSLLQITDEWTVKVSEVLNLLQKRIEEEKESREFEVRDLSRLVENLQKQFQVKLINFFSRFVRVVLIDSISRR